MSSSLRDTARSAERIRRLLQSGRTVGGVILFTGSPMVVELAAAAGLDFVVIDMEQSALDLERVAHCIRAADAAGIAPFVRVPELDRALAKKLLNLGVAGLVLPHADRESASALVGAMRYAPEGERGACPMVRAAAYARESWKEYASLANRETLAVPLLEDAAVLGDFESFAALPGLDIFFVGPTDLAVSLGVPGTHFDDPPLADALERVVATARRHGKYVMTTLGNRLEGDYARALAARGVQLLVYGTDADLFMDAMRRVRIGP